MQVPTQQSKSSVIITGTLMGPVTEVTLEHPDEAFAMRLDAVPTKNPCTYKTQWSPMKVLEKLLKEGYRVASTFSEPPETSPWSIRTWTLEETAIFEDER